MKKDKKSDVLFPHDRTMQAYYDLLPEDLQRLYRQSGVQAADVWDLHRQIEGMQRPKDR